MHIRLNVSSIAESDRNIWFRSHRVIAMNAGAISISFLVFLSLYTWVKINSVPSETGELFERRVRQRSIAIAFRAVESSLCEQCERGLRSPGDDVPRVKLHRYAAASARHVAARPIAPRDKGDDDDVAARRTTKTCHVQRAGGGWVWKVAHLRRCEVRHEPPRDPGPAWLQVAGMLLSHVESAILYAVQDLPEAGPEPAAVRAATPAGALPASVRPGAGTSSGVSSGMPSPGPLSRVSSGSRVRASSAATVVRGTVAASSRRWHRRRPTGLEPLLSHSSAARLVGRLFPEQIRELCTAGLARWIARSTLSGGSSPETARPRSDPPMDRRGDQKILTLARLQVLSRAHEGISSAKYSGNYRSRGRWPANVLQD